MEMIFSKLRTIADGILELGVGGPQVRKGTGSPEGVVAAPLGTLYLSDSGGSATTLYMKEGGGTGNTGWVAYSPGARDTPINANTLHCWNLNDAASPFADTGTAGATLAVSGVAIRYQQTGAGPNLGVALSASSKTFLTGAAGAANRPAGNNFTVLSWVRWRSIAGVQQIIHRKYTASGGTWVAPFTCLALNLSGGNLGATITAGANGAGASNSIPTDLIVSTGVDYLVALSYDGTTGSVYANGELLATNAIAANVDWNTAVEGPWVIGGVDSPAGNNPFVGVTRRALVYSTCLTKSEIQTIYKQGIGST